MHSLAVYSIKGGVGKTATAVNLAYVGASLGYRVLLWDLDPQGATSYYLRVKAKVKGGGRRMLQAKSSLDRWILGSDFDGFDLLPADFSYRHLDLVLQESKQPRQKLAEVLEPLTSQYDWLLLDCAPSISLVSEGVFEAVDALLVPTIPTTLSLRTLEQLLKHLKDWGRGRPQVLPFLSMLERRKSLHRKVAEAVARSEAGFLQTAIPFSALVEAMGKHRSPVAAYSPRCGPAACFRKLWAEMETAVTAGADGHALQEPKAKVIAEIHKALQN
ncbi:MAG: ParA family protein [Planctomycetota bacterium]|nr:MAG: ParA family protein [Planctomycetota bacterium]